MELVFLLTQPRDHEGEREGGWEGGREGEIEGEREGKKETDLQILTCTCVSFITFLFSC